MKKRSKEIQKRKNKKILTKVVEKKVRKCDREQEVEVANQECHQKQESEVANLEFQSLKMFQVAQLRGHLDDGNETMNTHNFEANDPVFYKCYTVEHVYNQVLHDHEPRS